MSLHPRPYSDVSPVFELSIYDQGEEVELLVNVTEDPSIKKPAPLGLMFGLAVLLMDRAGFINQMIESLLSEGPMNEVDAVNRIQALLKESTAYDGN